jgi:Secretion system C-terminal sorting domain
VLTNNNNLPAPTICNQQPVTRTVTWTYTSSCAPFTTTCTSTFTLPAYPDFTVPANGAATVACPAQATQPVPPVVLNGCGGVITPTGPVVTNNPNPLTCEGTRTYTWTYTDCAGRVKTWSFVYTVERLPFSINTPNGSATVACPDQTDVLPTPPVVTSNCGEVLTPVVTSTPKPGCEGNRNWNFTYTDCEGNTATWTFIYTVEYLDFTVPANQAETVECPFNVVVPAPPVVLDNCGKLLNAIGPVITSTYNAIGCEATRKYAWTYADCEGNTHTWSKTFTFGYSHDFYVYPDKVAEVTCVDHAVEPFPPTIYDCCGNEIPTTLVSVSKELSGGGCSGVIVYNFNYYDCGGHVHPWKFTYIINDNVAPTGTCPNLDVTNLQCIADVPCPEDDFSALMAELLQAGNFQDNCTADLNISLDSYTDLWQCSDPDGDGVSTFGRTFYFSIEDDCGNAYAELCEVTFSGVCQPICTFTQASWGNDGEAPGSSVDPPVSDAMLIQGLLNSYGPLKIGGSNRSMTFTDAQCILTLLPGSGGPSKLGNCHQTNCTGCNPTDSQGRLKNSLATNVISLMLNVRYNMQYNGLTNQEVLSQGLECIDIHPCLFWCNSATGVCQLRISDQNGTFYYYPYTLGGLLEMTNQYLDGNLTLSIGQQTLLTTMMGAAVENANNYWNGCEVKVICGDASNSLANANERRTGFEAVLEGTSVKLDWYISDNSTVDYFKVERSTDAENYKYVTFMHPTAEAVAQDYTTWDDYPVRGDNYYRLLIFRLNGEVQALPAIVTLQTDDEIEYSLAPNPADNEVYFRLNQGNTILDVNLDIFNSLGQQVFNKEFGQVGAISERIDLTKLSSGLYIVSIKVGDKRYERKLVVGNGR